MPYECSDRGCMGARQRCESRLFQGPFLGQNRRHLRCCIFIHLMCCSVGLFQSDARLPTASNKGRAASDDPDVIATATLWPRAVRRPTGMESRRSVCAILCVDGDATRASAGGVDAVASAAFYLPAILFHCSLLASAFQQTVDLYGGKRWAALLAAQACIRSA